MPLSLCCSNKTDVITLLVYISCVITSVLFAKLDLFNLFSLYL